MKEPEMSFHFLNIQFKSKSHEFQNNMDQNWVTIQTFLSDNTKIAYYVVWPPEIGKHKHASALVKRIFQKL